MEEICDNMYWMNLDNNEDDNEDDNEDNNEDDNEDTYIKNDEEINNSIILKDTDNMYIEQ